MATTKTKATENNVSDFIKSWAQEKRRDDSFKLIELMKAATGEEPKMWGPSIVGFGTYHYKYDSGHEGDAPLLGFSPRKAAISLYVYTGREDYKRLFWNALFWTAGKKPKHPYSAKRTGRVKSASGPSIEEKSSK